MAKQNKLEDFRERRLKGNEKIFAEDFLPYKRYFSLDNKAYEDGAIPVKYKELMGLVGSMVLRCNDCITYHIDHSIDAGCTKEELNEAMNIALVIGGTVVIPHLRHAMDVIEEKMEEMK
ncbi:MAG: alkylhydroperoxidase [Ignavibacteria bacterium GWB2_35_12]|nr:MAG: alkylhydroperoxidase [Ignavibacteria bacterium GWA2_35_8]OGU37958.1 MAG: alkylhydroperoxidase [Ignavibacteria bacterium GWB2_35_12]OGU85880.1 MAG: alkylhydroperoxidase [Ignavibacteria bacterium RIFOXYA2_FULL_35_10]OGV19714.1 MAG: alkylhydroperoxidase [Ignavibacteria bacterium RIFOXYC2_FULL_35_21]